MLMPRRFAVSVAILAGLLSLYYYWPPTPASIKQLSGLTMGTSYQVQLPALPEGKSESQVQQDVSDLLAEMDKAIFSTYADSSELSRLNRHPVNTSFSASEHLVSVLSLSADIADLSGGAFDVTVGPLVNLWGFGPKINPQDAVPDSAEIAAALAQIGHGKIEIDKTSLQVTKLEDVTIDLSAVAKGYAVDQLAGYFDSLGVESYFLEVGGELKIKGLKPGGVSWVPAIEAPIDTAPQVYEVFFSRGDSIAVAGSGDYRNYFVEDGVRYSHEIDPRTGYPIKHSLAAAYVIDKSAARADALATAYMVMGFQESRSLAESEGQAAYFIYKSPETGFNDYATPEFASYLEN